MGLDAIGAAKIGFFKSAPNRNKDLPDKFNQPPRKPGL